MPNVPYKYLKDDGELFYPVIGESSFDGAFPISKGGTGATTAAQARENLGINENSGLTIDLLWTNTSPASSYADGNLPLSLSAYSWVIIEYSVGPYFSIRSEWFPVPTFPPPNGYSAYNQLNGVYINGSNAKMVEREFQVSTTGIAFSSGVRVDAYATNQSTTTDNSVCRPLRIWGAK